MELKGSYENNPFCLDVVSLEVTPILEPKGKKKAPVQKTAVSKRRKVTKATVAKAAKGKVTDSEESVRWSDIEPESTTIRRKLPVKRAQTQATEGKGKAVVEEESSSEEDGEEAEATEEAEGDQPTEAERTTTIPTTSGAATSPQQRAAEGTGGESYTPEFTIDQEKKTMTLMLNTQQRYVPFFKPSQTPFTISEIMMHPEDLEGMKKSSIQEVGERGAHLAMSSLLINKYLCEKAKISESQYIYAREKAHKMKGLAKSYESKYTRTYVKLEAAAKKAEEDLISRDTEIQRLLSREEEEKAKLSKEMSQMKAALEQANKERDNAKATAFLQQAKHDREMAVKNETIKSMKAAMEKTFDPPPPVVTGDKEKDKIIEAYKESDDFFKQMKHYGEYGFVLLKRHMQKNQLLPQTTLDSLQYDNCIDEASDAESDNGAS